MKIMNNKHIVWENWNEIEKDCISKEDNFEENSSHDKDDGFDSDQQQILVSELISAQQSSPVFTPFGVYSDKSKLKPSDRWNCWIGNTNFEITDEVALKIEEAEGVAALRVMDRYSFCIGIAKQFDQKTVASKIQEAICFYEEQQESFKESQTLNIDTLKDLFKEYKFWSVYVHENGNLDWCFSNEDNDEEYLKNVDRLNLLKSKNGGFIINN